MTSMRLRTREWSCVEAHRSWRNHHAPNAGGRCRRVVCRGRHRPDARTLDIYLVDVEGGNATLFVAPSGESLLIDTGNGGAAAARDGDRIMAAVNDAGLRQIDHLITTHYHGDHLGAMENLAGRIPIREFIDHGPTVQPSQAIDAFLTDVYPKSYAGAKHTVVKPGDRVAMKAIDTRIVASAGQALSSALPGAGRAESVLRGLQAEGRRPYRERPVGRHAHHVREVQRPCTWAT